MRLQSKLPSKVFTEGSPGAERDATIKIGIEYDGLEKRCDAVYVQYYLDVSARYGIVAASGRSTTTKIHLHPSEIDDNTV
jgi:hypothetical protein